LSDLIGNKTADTSLTKLMCLCAMIGGGETKCINVSK
jgi:hypothetical protein